MSVSRFRKIGGMVLSMMLAATPASLAAAPPNTPLITEPGTDGQFVSPEDVHMVTADFSDPDVGDTHQCTDWQILTASTQEVVWRADCAVSVLALHIHLGDGQFVGSLAGRVSLLNNVDYVLRARHADQTGLRSAWATRTFRTLPETAVRDLEVVDALPTPPPRWINDATGQPVNLSGGVRLLVDNNHGDELFAIGADAFDAPPGDHHHPIRVRVRAGAGGFVQGPSTLSFVDELGIERIAVLPSLDLQPNEQVSFWVTEVGTTNYAFSWHVEPSYESLGRRVDAPWRIDERGFKVFKVASGFQLPVNIAFVPNPGTQPDSPLFYVTELYGKIKVVLRNGEVRDFATGLLNFNPTGDFPGSGELGVAGLVVHPTTNQVYASMLYSPDPNATPIPLYPKVVRFTSSDGGRTASGQFDVLNMVGTFQNASHQISSLSFGPDGKLYVHMGDGFDINAAQNLNSYLGKILRLNDNGTAPGDNPFYNANDGITARDYVFCSGIRNAFGGAWRASDGRRFFVENGPSVDRLAQMVRARNYLWSGFDADMYNFALYNWSPSTAPVNMAFVQPQTFNGSGFPSWAQGWGLITESGPTWALGRQDYGKAITYVQINAAGTSTTPPRPLITYSGTGRATAVALAMGPDGAYFSDLYKDEDYVTPIDPGANVFRVQYVGRASFDASTTSGQVGTPIQFTDTSDVVGASQWYWDFGDGNTSTSRNPTHVYTTPGTYTVRLGVVGTYGSQTSIRPELIRITGSTNPTRVALIGNELPPSPEDQMVANFLEQRGYQVTIMPDDIGVRPTGAQIAAEYDLVVVSATVVGTNIGGDFRNAPIPMVFWEPVILRPGREELTQAGTVYNNESRISIIDNSHPVTSGLPLGALTVSTQPTGMSFATGQIGPDVRVLAGSADTTGRYAIMVVEQGGQCMGGYIAPHRRVFMFFGLTSFATATPAALDIFEQSVCWALGRAAKITRHPWGGYVVYGQSISLSAELESPQDFSYRWHKEGEPVLDGPGPGGSVISGAETTMLTISNAAAGNQGVYTLIVSGPCSEVHSLPAYLAVGSDLCDPIDFNNDGLFPDTQDLQDFLSVFAGGACAPPSPPLCNIDIDFNNDGISPDVEDLQALINKMASGSCP